MEDPIDESESEERMNALEAYDNSPLSSFNRRNDGDKAGPFMDIKILTHHLFFYFLLMVHGDMWDYMDEPPKFKNCMEAKLRLVNVALRQECAIIHREFERVWWQFIHVFVPHNLLRSGGESRVEDRDFICTAGQFLASQPMTGHVLQPPLENYRYSSPPLHPESRGRATASAAPHGSTMQSLHATVLSLLPDQG